MNKFKEVKISHKTLKQYKEELDTMLADYVKLHDRTHRLPIETKSLNQFWK